MSQRIGRPKAHYLLIYREDQRRPGPQVGCRSRPSEPAADDAALPRPPFSAIRSIACRAADERLKGLFGDDRRRPDRSKELRRRLSPIVAVCVRSRALHLRKIEPEHPQPLSRRARSSAPQCRDHRRQTQRLAAHPHPLRQMRPNFILLNSNRRYLLVPIKAMSRRSYLFSASSSDSKNSLAAFRLA